MDSVCASATVARRDAGTEPPWMGLRRVAEVHTEFMSHTKIAEFMILSRIERIASKNFDSQTEADYKGVTREIQVPQKVCRTFSAGSGGRR